MRRLAREHRIDIRALKGSGTNGRVTAEDVLAAASTGAAVGQLASDDRRCAPPRRRHRRSPAADVDLRATDSGHDVPLTQARRIIAERMVESKHTAPHAWSMVEIDVTDVWKWRTREKDRFERETGYKLTLLPFFIRAVVESLAAFPLMNAKFRTGGRFDQASIYVNKDVNIGIAIGLPTNLVVPVIKQRRPALDQRPRDCGRRADRQGAQQQARRRRSRRRHVHRQQQRRERLVGLGADHQRRARPASSRWRRVVKKLVVRDDDSIAIRSMMNSCLSLDHRVVDGYVASGFLADLKRRLEAMGPQGEL